jgi:outer membrane protein assembly factor BamB/predicted MPP superfamily phosphohydrolase
MVSNGRDVAVSDAAGNYSLPFWGTHVYCVVGPDHSPFDGAVVTLTDCDSNYDLFPTACKHPTGEFTFVQMADCHLSQPGVIGTDGRNLSSDCFERALRQIKSEMNPDFLILTGDQVDIGVVGELQVLYEILDRVGLPAIQVNGNHEGQCKITDRTALPAVDASLLDPNEQIEDFYYHFGPTRFAFFWGRYLFIVLDSMSQYAPDQHQWLRALLSEVADDTPVVAAVHHPETPFWCFPELFARNLRMIISGHYHTPQTFWQGGVLHSSPSPCLMAGHDGFPPAYRAYRLPDRDSKKITYETINLNVKQCFQKLMISRCEEPNPTFGTGPLELLWRQRLDGAVKSAGPVIANDCIVVTPHDLDADPVGRIQVFDASNGRLLWQRRLGDGFFGSAVIAPAGIPEVGDDEKAHWRTDPINNDKHIFLQSMTGQVYCLSLQSGNILWQQQLGPRAGRVCPESVALTEELVLAGDSTCFAAFHRSTGQQHWIWPEDPLARVGSFRTAAAAAGAGVVLVGSAYDENGVLALDCGTGKLRWTCGDRQHARFGNAVFADDCFYFFGPRELTCVTATTGKVKWQTSSDPWSYAAPLVTDERVFAATSNGRLMALDRQTGRCLWTRTFNRSLAPLHYDNSEASGQLASPARCGRHILYPSSDGHLYAVDAETGNTVWKESFEMPLTSTPVVRDDRLFLITPEATLWNFRVASISHSNEKIP